MRVGLLLLQIQHSSGTLDVITQWQAQGVTEAGIDPFLHCARESRKPSLGTQATPESHPRSSTWLHKRTYMRALRRAQLKGEVLVLRQMDWAGPPSPDHQTPNLAAVPTSPYTPYHRQHKTLPCLIGTRMGWTLR